MRAADEAAFVDTADGAGVFAGAAADAFVVVDGGEVVDECYRALGAGLDAFAAGDTAVDAVFADCRAFVVVATLDGDARRVANEVDDVVGARRDAETAADTAARVNVGDAALVDADGGARANGDAVAVAEAGEGAEAIARIVHVGGAAGARSVVVVFTLLGAARAVAGDVGDHFDDVGGGKPHYRGDLARSAVAPWDAEVDLVGLPRGERLGVAVTAREAASAAIGTWKTVAQGLEALVFLDGEASRGDGEEEGAERACREENEDGN